MNKYQITLRPVDKFFFGGDMTFKIDGQGKQFNEQYSSYIIQSLMFPQQTSLLGMLRFLVLRNAGEDVFSQGKIVDKVKAAELIGENSFMVNADHSRNSFGKIKGLSHVRIRRTEQGQTRDLEFAPRFQDLCLDDMAPGYYYPHGFSIPRISKKQYNAKNGLPTLLTDGAKTFTLDEIFKEDYRTGIERSISTGKVDDNALFKQISYRFCSDKADHCFVFEAEVEDDLALEKYHRQMVSVGGDNSQFLIGIEKVAGSETTNSSANNTVCLFSPTFLTGDEARKASFAVSDLMPFRFLTSTIHATSYHILSQQLKRSGKYELFVPGSVFFFESESHKREFIDSIEAKRDFRQIGYNEYK